MKKKVTKEISLEENSEETFSQGKEMSKVWAVAILGVFVISLAVAGSYAVFSGDGSLLKTSLVTSGDDATNRPTKTDKRGPVLTSIKISPTSVDTSTEDVTLTLNATIVDPSGVCISGDNCTSSPTQFRLSSVASSSQMVDFYELKSLGNNKYTATAVMKKGSAPGKWQFTWGLLLDKVGNRTDLSYDQMAKIPGAVVDVMNNGGETDVEGPELTAITISPTSVDTSTEDVTLTLNATIVDPSGVCINGDNCTSSPTQFRLSSVASSSQMVDFYELKSLGNNKYTATAVMKKGSASGKWQFTWGLLLDKVGNRTDLSYDQMAKIPGAVVDVMNNGGETDVEGPELTAITISPTSVDTSTEDVTLTLNATIVDPSGVCISGDNCTSSPTQFRLSSVASSSQMVDFYELKSLGNNKYTATAVMKKGSASGKWQFTWGLLLDKVGNRTDLSYDQMAKIPGAVVEIVNR